MQLSLAFLALVTSLATVNGAVLPAKSAPIDSTSKPLTPDANLPNGPVAAGVPKGTDSGTATTDGGSCMAITPEDPKG